MLKKILLTILLITTLFGLGRFCESKVMAQVYLADEDPAPSGDIKSDEFMFNLGAITHGDIQEQNWIRKGINYLFERAITIMAATVGSVAVLMMSVGGFMMLASAGRQEMYDKGKSLIFKAVIGIIFVLGAYILVTTIQLLIKSIYG